MIISVTAPKKGMGQTQCAINLTALLSEYIQGKVILADINKYSKDIGYYFSDTQVTKGLDNVISLIESGLVSKESFKTCTKEINKKIDILISNECFEFKEDMVQPLVECMKGSYDAVVIDTISGGNIVTRQLLEYSDVIVVVINQYKNVLDMMVKENVYREYMDKTVLIVNRYTHSIGYGMAEIRGLLGQAGLDCEVFNLSYDVEMINESNDHAVLNYMLNYNSRFKETRKQMEVLVRHIIDKHGKEIKVEEKYKAEKAKKHAGFLGFRWDRRD